MRPLAFCIAIAASVTPAQAWAMPGAQGEAAGTESRPASAQQSLDVGAIDRTIRQLREALERSPQHEQAALELAVLKSMRERAIEQGVAQARHAQVWREHAIHDALFLARQRAAAPPHGGPMTPDALPPAADGLSHPAMPPSVPEPAQAGSAPSASSTPQPPTPAPAPESQGGLAPRLGFVRGINQAIAPVSINGELRSSIGFDRDDVILREANGDYNERNFRILFGNQHENTFDPALYDRVRLNVDAPGLSPVEVHANLTVDPWSFVGTTGEFEVVGADPTDRASLDLKYWGNTNRAINEFFWTDKIGDRFSTPEIEVDDGHTVNTTLTSIFTNTYAIPERDIDYRFHPLREFWLGYRSDVLSLRMFPIAYENQALISDDPLSLSGHQTYWQWSPWIEEWRPGRYLPRSDVNGFVAGEWTHALAFFTRDSDLQRLTALRGATLKWQPADQLSVQGGIASPKTLWQEYESWNSLVGMLRPKYQVLDALTVGGIYTTRWAYNERALDAYNHVYGLDAALTPMDWLVLEAEGGTSYSTYDRSLARYEQRGWLWHLGLTLRSFGLLGGGRTEDRGEAEAQDEASAPYTPPMGARQTGGAGSFRLHGYYTHMDEAFDPGLANYRETRDDTFWGRHLSFYRPLRDYQAQYARLAGGLAPIESLEAFRIGDGIDIGRDVLGARLTTSLLDGRWEGLYDHRNVHDVNGKFIEDVTRAEQTLRVVPRLTGKLLFIYHRRHDTVGGIDPFLFDTDTGLAVLNTQAPDGQDPSTMTFGSGLEFELLDQLSLWGIWEATQEAGTWGSDNYPRGLFNDTTLPLETRGDQRIRLRQTFLYDQHVFPKPPYPWDHIFKVGLHWEAGSWLEGNLSWTRNTYEFAGQIDENMNHIGLELGWHPTKALSVISSYTLSHSVSLPQIAATSGAAIHNDRHHNLYLRTLYEVGDESELAVEYGVGRFINTYQLFVYDPRGQHFPTLDTEHLVRVVYTCRF